MKEQYRMWLRKKKKIRKDKSASMAKENNKDWILKLLKENKNRETAEEIAAQLDIQRNTASGILNDLVREGLVQKEKTRPVMFSYIEPEEELPDDPFTTFIGADQSLKDAVEKCKLSAGYPNRGMPILLFGSSGVGKSLLAEYIYKYAKFIGMIPEDAPFVVLNCADYANNKELLSSVLFGYKKGAFTGANKDTKGLIEEADNGYLFLDEVHRLSPEGQEKLFRYMDKGIISRMGDSGQNCELNVRLIFATTEGSEDDGNDISGKQQCDQPFVDISGKGKYRNFEKYYQAFLCKGI